MVFLEIKGGEGGVGGMARVTFACFQPAGRWNNRWKAEKLSGRAAIIAEALYI